jgi:tetratricopeptide (TPR) repeat protein
MCFSGDAFETALFHGMAPPLLSSFKDLAGLMGKAGAVICMMVFGALLGESRAAPATFAVIAEIQAALDKGDAQHAANLADGALGDEVSAPERGRLLLYRGLAQELLGKPDEAMGDFTRALGTRALLPADRAQALLQRGFLHDGREQLGEAAADYTAVIMLNADGVATALNNRANIYRRQNRLGEARRDYQAALAAGGGKPQYAWYGLGQIAETQNDTLAARGFYAKAVAAGPDYALAAQRLAALGGPPEDAIARPDAITLRPPPDTGVGHGTAPVHAATEASRDPDGSIVLHAPGVPMTQGNRVHGQTVALRQPTTRLHPAASPSPRADTGLILRPALDARPAARGGAQVQLGAWRSQAEAQNGWAKALAKAGEALDGLSPQIVAADIPAKGRYWRLRVTPAAGQTATRFCTVLAARGVACLPARD